MAIQPKWACKPTGESQCLCQLDFIKLFNGNLLNQELAVLSCYFCLVSGVCVSQLQSNPIFVFTDKPAHAAMCLVDQPLFHPQTTNSLHLKDYHLSKHMICLQIAQTKVDSLSTIWRPICIFYRCSFSDCNGFFFAFGVWHCLRCAFIFLNSLAQNMLAPC